MSRALALALAMVVLALLLATPHAGTQAQDQVEVKIKWVTYINPTDGIDLASGTCALGDYIAVVGEANRIPPYVARGKPYVVLLRKSDGGIERKWIGNEVGGLYNCISIGGKLYAVGTTFVDNNFYGVIYIFDVNLNILARIRSESPSGYFSLVYDGKALYLGGWSYEDVDEDSEEEVVGLVEKRTLDASLPSVNSKKIYFGSWKWGLILDIGVEPSTGRIWAVGFYGDSNDKEHSLIVIFDDSLRVFRIIDYPEGSRGYLGRLAGIVFDGRQYAYISGPEGVAKFSADGELVVINKDGKERYKIVYGYNYLYTFGRDGIRGYLGHVLYIHDTNLNIVKRYELSENPSYFDIGRPALEGNNIYVAGHDETLGKGNSRVVVYSLSIESVAASDRALTQLIVVGLAAIGVALAIVLLAVAFLLLRRR